jgi:hypothetical protein
MAVYLQPSTEENLYDTIVERSWNSSTHQLSHWSPGDRLIIYVNRELAAMFLVREPNSHDTTASWADDLYNYRVPVELIKLIDPDHRYPITAEDIQDLLYRNYNRSYPVTHILGSNPVDREAAQTLIAHIEELPAWEDFDPHAALRNVTQEQQATHDIVSEYFGSGSDSTPSIEPSESAMSAYPLPIDDLPPEPEPIPEAPLEASAPPIAEPEEVATLGDLAIHTEMQFYLAKLGLSLGYYVWLPEAHRRRAFQGAELDKLSIPELPYLPFSQDVVDILRQIDVLWFEDRYLTHAFEIEASPSVYAGLLRIADIAALLPSMSIDMYLCADDKRLEEITTQVNRPTFGQMRYPLADRTRFIGFNRLSAFMDAQQEALGSFDADILEQLSEPLNPGAPYTNGW